MSSCTNVEQASGQVGAIDATNLTSSTQTVWFLTGPLLANHALRHIPVTHAGFVVGRSSKVDLGLPSLTVSSRHCEMTPTARELVLRDLDSTNGTFVNGQRIEGQVTVTADDLVQFADMPFRILRQNTPEQSTTVSRNVVDEALALVQFETLMREQAVIPHYQPIIRLSDEKCLAYEVLGRSRLPGLEMPHAMFTAAAQLDLEVPLSVMMRIKGIEESRHCPRPPHIFLNTHPEELKSRDLLDNLKVMREIAGTQPLTLEIHERAIAEMEDLKSLRTALQDHDIGLAFDDFGAGQSRLLELLELHPETVKFDMSLIRDVDQASDDHKRILETLIKMVQDIGSLALAEGVETPAEAEACRDLGFSLAQGFLFGRPTPMKL